VAGTGFVVTTANLNTAINTTIATTDKLTPQIISKVKAYAILGGATTSGVRPNFPLQPVMVNGRKYFILLVHPYVMYDLKQDSTFQQWMREAEVRGPTNPLFTGATAIVDGVVIHEHESVPFATNGGAGGNVPYAQCMFLGAQAVLKAWGKRPEVITKKFGYDEEEGYAWKGIFKFARPYFTNSAATPVAKEYGSIPVYAACTNLG
jgi:N4-gp56 family major capsid protein